jgi:WD40 repeat protein
LVIAEDRNLHRFELPDLKLETSVPNAAGATIYSLCSVDWHGTRALAVGSDSMRDGDRTELMLIRIRDFDKLLTLSEFAPAYSHESSSGSSGPIRIHSTVSVGGKDILLARDGASLVLFELGSGIEVTRLHSYSRMTSKIIAVVSKEHRTFVLGNSYGRLLAVELFSQAFDLTSSQHSTPMLVAHPLDTEIDLGGELWSQTINLHNRTVAANAQGPKLLLWDIDELSIASLNQSQSEVKDRVHFFGEGALNAVASNGMHVAAGGYDGNVWIWDMAGRLISKHQISGNAVQAMAFVTIDTTPVLLVASGNGVLHRIYVPAKPKAFPIIKTGEEIWGMALHTLDSQIIAFLAVNLNERGKQGRYVVRAWDIESGKEVNTNVDDDFSSDLGGTVQGWGLEALGYYRTKTLYAVSVLEWNDHVLISLAGPHGEVRTIDLNTFSQIDRWEGGVSGDYVHSLIAGIDGNTPLIFGGDEAGRLFCRDVSNKKEHCSRVDTAHRGSINSLLLPETKGGRILVSGGDDGIICFWTMDLRKLAQIETDRPVRALALPSNERLVVANDRGVTVLSLNWQQLTFNLCQ